MAEETEETDAFERFGKTASPEGGAHRLERVMLFELLSNPAIAFVNQRVYEREIHPMSELVSVSARCRGAGRCRYQYQGLGTGDFNGYFTKVDSELCVCRGEDGKTTVASVPPYNVAHLLCDIMDGYFSDEFVEWMSSDTFRRREACRALRRVEDELRRP